MIQIFFEVFCDIFLSHIFIFAVHLVLMNLWCHDFSRAILYYCMISWLNKIKYRLSFTRCVFILQNNYKIQATRLTHEIDDMRRRLENAKMKLTAEMKVCHLTAPFTGTKFTPTLYFLNHSPYGWATY